MSGTFNDGYIKLHRKLLENPMLKNHKHTVLWITLLLRANHKPSEMWWNNSLIKLEPGQFITSREKLSDLTGIKQTTCEDILNTFETRHQIRQQKFTKFRIITIEKWKEYQIDNIKSDTKTDNKPTTNRQQTDTNKNDKNDKNDNNILASQSDAELKLNDLIELFKPVNPSYERIYANKTQRSALERMVKKHGVEKITWLIQRLPITNKTQYAPTITTPYQLEMKLGDIIAFFQKKKAEQDKSKIPTL